MKIINGDEKADTERAPDRAGNETFGRVRGTAPGTMDTIFTISGIYFLYNFLVRDSGITGNGVHSVQNQDLLPGSWTDLLRFPGSFFCTFFS
ncbi:MAG: hypothetical protein CVV30_11770 [Methanomicrobiales archaeon HGW-Methanomicrobiales-1]|jgi:hypothetical protein|nr:MAG: hypothetical protein CVV30_11770 [Methanomicrobiales archaeon HGW-Methanomicrobiales-1]